MSKMSPMELLNKVREKANLETKEYDKQVVVKLNKAGKVKLQLIALNEDLLFRARTQHFIPVLPDNDDPAEKVMVIDCKGEGCPVCDAALSFKNSGVTVEQINEAYNPKFPYTKVRSVLTQPEHFLIGVRILVDQAEDGTYLPKDEEIGSTQILQLSKSALNSLMSAYDDFISDYDGEYEDLPPLFATIDDCKDDEKIKSFSINCRVQTQPWSYNFTFGKAVEVAVGDINKEKLNMIKEPTEPSEDYLEKALKRIRDLQNYFVGGSVVSSVKEKVTESKTSTNLDDVLDDEDFDLDTL